MTEGVERLEVTQADRDAALAYSPTEVGMLCGWDIKEHPLAVAFARHRIAAEQAHPSAAAMREAADAGPMDRCVNCGQMHIEHDRVGTIYVCAGTAGARFQARLPLAPSDMGEG